MRYQCSPSLLFPPIVKQGPYVRIFLDTRTGYGVTCSDGTGIPTTEEAVFRAASAPISSAVHTLCYTSPTSLSRLLSSQSTALYHAILLHSILAFNTMLYLLYGAFAKTLSQGFNLDSAGSGHILVGLLHKPHRKLQ